MGLKEYHRKRDFSSTSEPYGKYKKHKKQQLVYLIQKHAASHMHYDFRLELEGSLKSWAVPKGPSLDPKIKHLAVHVEDHPLEYANFEGIIPEGQYGGGTVMIWDQGYWDPLDEDPIAAYHKGNLSILLHGKKLQGRWKLIRTRGGSSGKEQWLLFKVTDEHSRSEKDYDITVQQPFSAKSDRSLKEIKEDSDRVWTSKGEQTKHPDKKTPRKKKLPKINLAKLEGTKKSTFLNEVRPELATLVTTPPAGDNWLHEIKWDGYRLLIQVRKGKIRLLTRRGNDWTDHFPALLAALTKLNLKDIILDGEVVALDKERKANFQLLQNSLEESAIKTPLIFYAFDLLYYDGYSLLGSPLIERKQLLKKILAVQRATPEIKYNDHVIGKGSIVFQNACDLNLEGIIAKKITSHYIEQRTKDWLKIKCTQRQEFVIGGFTDPKSSREYFGALLLGYYEGKDLIYCGKVGTGFTQSSLKELSVTLKKHEQKKMPFVHYPEKNTRHIHWLQPVLVSEIEFLSITSEGLLRHPSFKGLRLDKRATAVNLEEPKDMPTPNEPSSKIVKFTNLNKVLYPQLGITKKDLLSYYENVAELILPHIKNRPLTLVRCPHGAEAKCFYQKHYNESIPKSLKEVQIEDNKGREPYLYLNNIDGLFGIVQMGVLELHPWGSTIKSVEKPDRIIFDLDPAPDVSWQEVIKTANLLRQFLEQLGLVSFVKTTGGKGLHVVVPIRAALDWDDIKDFTKQIADLIVELNPNKYIATMSKAKRVGKVFIDYLRNSRGATSIAPYSTRAKANGSIAMPLYWDELTTKIHSDSFTLENINKRLKSLKSDPWEDMLKTKQSITIKMRKMLGL
jgi:bifunctional non-homologous end joining protein LigD